ncbi:hypothetical protein DV451_002502 [Geotrichum candidum]|uniref:Uncharacterized protein n=1 Tax=Geotrichum candidum TaxID=1173061 RepID=A0A9P5KU42_GEOCN|nr:hypothetical protein DV451_002502 [Geotrichum candidum]KAF5107799.1 hypothetical protein DV453_002826 [Geotrichum candidum]
MSSTSTLLPTYSSSEAANLYESVSSPHLHSETLSTEMPQPATPAGESPSPATPTNEPDFNLNDLFKNFPEEFLQNLSNVLGKQNEFINNVGDYIVNKTTPVFTTLAEQLITEIQKQVVTKGSDLHDKINNDLPEALDAVISEFKNSTKDFSQLKLLRKFLEKLEALKNTKFETNSNGASVSLNDVHDVLRESVQDNWTTGARLVSKKYGESSKIIFEIAPTQSYTFVLPVHTGVTVKELSADSWFVKSESFEIPLEINASSIEGADQPQEQESLAKSLSSSEVVLPKLPVESPASSSIASSNSNLQSSKSDFTSSAMDMFMSIPNETSAGEKTVDEDSGSDSDASLLIVSRTASPSIMAASLSGVDTDYEDDHVIDEDDMFTESEYAFV